MTDRAKVRAAVVALLQADTDGAACRALAKALGVSTERGDDDFAEDAIDQRIADTLLSLAPAGRGTPFSDAQAASVMRLMVPRIHDALRAALTTGGRDA
jgi:hypothetical protein